ncbi:hypothetical protein [Telmatospirillum siberiense]|uniref:Uncharacterized protein n=1 Tax=Telmatospirillum siberiense TaxID=382514 RepID=A0A2N3PNA0_9PROT|nr:hypothetical protein [Telmatospirillum siberiense]PKU21879.1 hypothetical protein CWS72_24665 [Telmatospirillum siberiense]
MSAAGRAEMHRVVDRLLADFLRLVAERHRGAPVDGEQLREAAQSFAASPQLNNLLSEAHQRFMVSAEMELIRQRRGDPFQRLLAHPFSDLFADGSLSRDILSNYFSFLHLVLGDARDTLTEHCNTILRELKTPDSLAFSWDSFYEDIRAKLILWTVLARIAESFRRFDARRDWFIGLMQHRPQAISISANSFVPRPQAEDPQIFGVEEFKIMFAALFRPLRGMSRSDALAFERHFKATAEHVFGALLNELEAAGAPL